MNEELRGKIAKLLFSEPTYWNYLAAPKARQNADLILDQILSLIKELGYRKVCGEPLVLSDEEINKVEDNWLHSNWNDDNEFPRMVAKAQLDKCVRFYAT